MLALALSTSSCSRAPDPTLSGAGNMSCKLQDDKIVEGRTRHCLYRCDGGALEGRSRGVDQSCPGYINSDTRQR